MTYKRMTYKQYMSFKSSWIRQDSYKYSHPFQYPEGMKAYHGYIEPRGSKLNLKEIESQVDLINYLRPRLLLDENLNVNRMPFFGPKAWFKKMLENPLTEEQVEYFDNLLSKHGEPFDKETALRAVREHGGHLPLRFKTLPEGTLSNIHAPQVVVESMEEYPEFARLGGFIETQIHRATWYPTTVAGISYTIKQIITYYLEKTGDIAGLPFKLHDFGMRGGSSEETCEIGGLAHLVNFMGSDTIDAMILGDWAYNVECAGYSIPASEHSTMTALGPLYEWVQMQRMLNQFPKHGIVACVSDSYNVFNAVENIWGDKLRQEVIDSGKTLVIRPDSGDPLEINMWIVEKLAEKFGFTVNDKGYKVLNHVRMIQGDGVCPAVIAQILQGAMDRGYSADNWAFGMGGALLQKLDRDTFKYAMKCSALDFGNGWVDVYKDPITDTGKRSLRGRVGTKWENGKMVPCKAEENTLLQDVVVNGQLLIDDDFDTIRARANADPLTLGQ